MEKKNGCLAEILAKLRAEWAISVAVGLCLLAAATGLVRLENAGWAARFSLTAGLVMAYVYFHLYRNLGANSDLHDPRRFYTSLGAANWITMLRAVLLALLTGFLFLPRPEGWMAWAPAALYTSAALLDYLDGSVARLSGRASRLGEILDMHWDGYGVLIAALLLALAGQVPAWYLLVGLARYLFVGGLWLRRRMGKPVYDLPPNMFRRALAGVQMGFIAVALMPLFTPPATHVAAALFALPLLTGFVRDWFAVSGVKASSRTVKGWRKQAGKWGPFALRIALGGLLAFTLVDLTRGGSAPAGALLVGGAAFVGLVLGAAGRFFGLVVLLMSGLALQAAPLDWRLWALLLLGTAVMTFGTGAYSIWRPEDWLIHHRIGDPKGS